MAGKTDSRLTQREKAAILLIAMGRNQAAQIFKYLSEEEIATLTLAITTTSKVTKEESEGVLAEFLETCLAQKYISEGGLDYARGVLKKALGDTKAGEILDKLTETLQVRPFEFVRKADTMQIVHLVANENPQTIALLLSYLEPKKASSVLAALPNDMQVDVVTRMANMESVIPEYIREAEMILEQRLAKMGMSDQTTVGGIDAVVKIINSVDRGTEKNILESLDILDPDLSENIKKNMFVFEDIAKLSNQAIQRVLKDVQQSDIAISLKGANEEVRGVIMSNLSKRLQEMIADDLSVMGPMRMKDVEDAQQRIVNAVRALEENGEIIVSRGTPAMSSFRIDRQYVAFETAETEPVYATVKTPAAKPEQTDDKTIYNGDISKLYNEIYERLQNEHAEQAEYMLSKAAGEAQEIVDKAKKHAEEIVQQARSDTEKMREELIGQMETTSAQRKSQAETGLIELETKLRNDYSTLVDSMHSDVIALVMEIVKKIIGIKLSQSDEIFMGMIKDAIEQLKQTGSVLVRVSPEDYARYFGSERDELGLDNSEIKITVVEEPNFSQGDLIVESEGEMIDLGINRQIDLVEKAFLD